MMSGGRQGYLNFSPDCIITHVEVFANEKTNTFICVRNYISIYCYQNRRDTKKGSIVPPLSVSYFIHHTNQQQAFQQDCTLSINNRGLQEHFLNRILQPIRLIFFFSALVCLEGGKFLRI